MAVNYNYRNQNKDKLILWFYLNFVCQRSSHGTGNIELYTHTHLSTEL